MIPLPISDKDVTFMPCCGKDVCCGCTYKNMIAENKANRTPELEYRRTTENQSTQKTSEKKSS